MLRGIDISNWQAGLDADAVFPNVDFVICKATEGIGFVDGYCDSWVQWCRRNGKPWGFYHFANVDSPAMEATHFINNTSNYFGEGIPVLDWEGGQSVEWVNEFVNIVHDQTGIWPWIYANPWRFNQGGVESNCGRWIASYPAVTNPSLDYDPGDVPQTDGLVVCWQYASDGMVSGYSGNLDVNHFFGDAKAWGLYAGFSTSNPPSVENPKSSVLENDEYRVEITKK